MSAITSPQFARRMQETFWEPFKSPIQVRVELQGTDIEDGRHLQLGCRSGPVEDIYGLLHEMSHFVEIDDARILVPNWGLKMPEVYIPGRYSRMCPNPVGRTAFSGKRCEGCPSNPLSVCETQIESDRRGGLGGR